MKKYAILVLMLICIFFNIANVNASINVNAEGCVLVDLQSDKILFEKNKDLKLAPASTTKIMTALLTIEKCNLNDKVIIGKKPPFADGSKIYLMEGEELTVEQLLNALLIESANDAAQALAEYISGSEEEFAKLMNQRAVELGCKNTHFVNASGLYDPNHYTSAYDLYLITKKAFEYPKFREIVSKVRYEIPPTNKQLQTRYLYSHNKLINGNRRYRYQWADGVKTGYTIKSKHAFVGSATKDGRTLIAVVLKSNAQYYNDIIKLFDYGFNDFQTKLILDKNTAATHIIIDNKSIPLYPAEDIYITLKKNDNFNDIEKKINVVSNIEKFTKGETLGSIDIYKNNNLLKSVPLIANEDFGSLFYDLKYVETGKYKKRPSNWIVIPTIIVVTLFFYKKFKRNQKFKIKKEK
ncbi:D-alanyl-D-alanine carboxypeptidase family protein [Caloramator australicus]|uniref:serine-type D-Ala-D-Ala carboxypeptidase n=1 Tax=Caloramator australicus RC3 TaxID=857293 RepID=I7KU90_9CLOT|nr:D-alanyl-D-alanine carboxypeptidase family protein [Caloramator australicus]CCJ33428.1 D-alanyl-D-alanine carboxypeptidase [Caloramator australicus RC3]